MKTVRESTTLYNFLGSHNPYWRLTESSDVLRFSTTEITEPDRILQLSAEQAARIREMTVITSSLMMSLTVDESDLSVHLVGRKINKREWGGNASAWHDTPAVARDLSHGLSFAEQVVSEAHSAIVILDSRGNIQRFNRLCEDYTGLKEHDVIGQSMFKLFMSRRVARHPGAITVYFFEAAMHMKSNCGYQHVKASGCFCFAINLSTAAVAKTRFFNLFRHRHYRRAPRSGATAYSGKYRQYHRTAES